MNKLYDPREYLNKISERTKENNNEFQAYLINNNKSLELIEFDKSRIKLNKKVKDKIKDLEKNLENFTETHKIAFINYSLHPSQIGKNSPFGIMSIGCSILNINKNCELTHFNMLSNSIFYKEEDIRQRGVKKNDYKKLILGLLKGKIDNNPLKIIGPDKIDTKKKKK